MNKNKASSFTAGILLLTAFCIWTMLIQTVDVQSAGVEGTKIGFAAVNTWFHRLTGVHLRLYTVTDWLGLIPLFVCLLFAVLGAQQLLKRRSLFSVDGDILLLGLYYCLVIFFYLLFETIPVNYRPVLIDGYREASYPSSTTLLVLTVMPTLVFQTERRCRSLLLRNMIRMLSAWFSAFMVVGRLFSGVHWCTDIIGSVLLSMGLFRLYRFSVEVMDRRVRQNRGKNSWNFTKSCRN